ncbi:MAG TPA: choice-of-anchor Q domain-containing protein, partial [Solirubrobacterales bacterium]|nr:choice-of-anchor Q domain-containing protein [Solirubrobacterales bacterium]
MTRSHKLFRGVAKGIGALTVACALLLAPSAANATDWLVENTNDSGPDSLRQAIGNANGNSGPDRIALFPTGTLTLASPLPTITDDVEILAAGGFIVDGADLYRPFTINAGKTVSMSGFTVTNGLCNQACGSVGGGIYNDGTLTLTDVDLSGNTASGSGGTDPLALAGGIFNSGTLSLVQTTVTGNTAQTTGYTNQGNPSGGGIYNAGTLTVDRSTIDSNTATATGGQFTNVHGGGIFNQKNLTITRSTVSNNAASGTGASTQNSAYGAAIANTNDPVNVHVSIDRATVGGNTATVDSPEGGEIGGVEAYGATFAITSSTLAHNNGANLSVGTTVDVKNTIISDPAGGGLTCLGSVSSQGYNLSSDSGCGFSGPQDQVDTNPMLAATLAANGGPTKTYALLSGSPAIDQGKSSTGETVDQR